MLRKKRKIAVIVDNCPAHQKIAGLKAVELVFLPPNTTSNTQPMDHGIILNLKVHYLKRVLLKFIKSIDRDETPNINVLDALHLLSQALNCVTSSTVSNCFGHAGFAQPDPVPPAPEEDDDFDNDNV
ncbi:tigger transposable element-derived protein 4-like [Crassostrea angulata]|uniref:tigger transposable element-derived protein 4-like n=1 Tax=Magallana angulata TaxID=2784310 RepID=UPI0022B1572C|nr:tigger transposable element-derived protein 4-like [Crassostrea angulata]